MPSHLTKKIFPSFHQHEKDEDDDASIMSRSSSITLVNPDDSFSLRSSSSPHAKVPKHVLSGLSAEDKAAGPQETGAISKTYPEDAIAPSHPDDLSDNKTVDPGPSLVDPSVRICPHEKLSFERLQRILNLDRFKSSYEGIEAIGAKEEPQHLESLGSWTCYPNGTYTNPRGTFKFKYNHHHSKNHGWKILLGPVIGLELSVTWTLGYYTCGMIDTEVKESLEKLGKVKLCPHKKLNDPWILQIIRREGTPDASSDPVDQWEKPRPTSFEENQECDQCKTHIQVTGDRILSKHLQAMVKVTRCLGPGVSANDPDWLAQCGA
ncbi:hypothetical protein IMSHALPRED_008633 [Imshaugia aleurites]|uniref:Uncharacterized protein n=1 Tax=Imshaugia aleurites TaxID=172621 RepID=A0A8H3FVE7_9LECA|nr:hypothetical protein IMSHALPRED_008633 [Imshaugia aleurites]